jgi:VCBS repeat-containing protein
MRQDISPMTVTKNKVAKRPAAKKSVVPAPARFGGIHLLITGVTTLAIVLGVSMIPWTVSAATTLFANGFELNSFTGWTSVSGVWSVQNGGANTGSKKAEAKGDTGSHTDILQKNISTVGKGNLTLSYAYKIAAGLESADHIKTEWSTNGTTWTTLADYSNINTSNNYVNASFVLPSGAEDKAGFELRFTAHLDSNGDQFWLDDVLLTGDILNHAPIANDDTYNTNEDTNITKSAANGVLSNDTDDDSDPFTAVLKTDVSHGTLTFHSDGSFDYTPNTNWDGTDIFTYVANDGKTDSTPATVYIVVSNVNDAPIAQDDEYSIAEDSTLTVNALSGVLANDSDVDGDSLTAGLEIDVNDGILTLNSDGSFVYTPDANWSGTESFTYKANDGVFNSSAHTVTIHVTPANDAPSAIAQSVSTTQDTPVSGVLSGTDPEGDTLSFATSSNPQHGTLTINTSTGAFTYTPDAGYTGSDLFSFTTTDGALTSAAADVTITVNAAPVTPPSNGGGNSGGSNGGGGGGGVVSGPLSIGYVNTNPVGGGAGGGLVLGTSTEDLPAGCSAYLNSYLRMGAKNNSDEVKKLQTFLNTQIGAKLPVTGVFGPLTFAAVEKFQVTNWEKVLKPWVAFGLPTDHTPTGYVYKTTKHTINLLVCASLAEPEPQLP